jgi:putative ubiquitin-RnfH superfamily antitoxin RatB of RatAB toxin-antitoxin module
MVDKNTDNLSVFKKQYEVVSVDIDSTNNVSDHIAKSDIGTIQFSLDYNNDGVYNLFDKITVEITESDINAVGYYKIISCNKNPRNRNLEYTLLWNHTSDGRQWYIRIIIKAPKSKDKSKYPLTLDIHKKYNISIK